MKKEAIVLNREIDSRGNLSITVLVNNLEREPDKHEFWACEGEHFYLDRMMDSFEIVETFKETYDGK